MQVDESKIGADADRQQFQRLNAVDRADDPADARILAQQALDQIGVRLVILDDKNLQWRRRGRLSPIKCGLAINV